MKRFLAIMAFVMLAACGHTPQVAATQPGESLQVRGLPYAQVWQESRGAVGNLFHVDSDEGMARGEILGEGNGCAYGAPADYVGVYITPTAPQSPAYTIKIVADSVREGRARTVRDYIAKRLAAAGAEVR